MDARFIQIIISSILLMLLIFGFSHFILVNRVFAIELVVQNVVIEVVYTQFYTII